MFIVITETVIHEQHTRMCDPSCRNSSGIQLAWLMFRVYDYNTLTLNSLQKLFIHSFDFSFLSTSPRPQTPLLE